MKTFGLFLAIIFGAATVFAADSKAEKTAFEIDTKESKVHWMGKKVTGEHTGHLQIADGTVYVKGDEVVGANVNMDLTTIECTDLSGEWKDKLVGHLKSDDFFSVEKHPTSIFKITGIKQEGAEKMVTGDLTIKGITHKVSFPAKLDVADNKVKASGTAVIDRTKYDIKYGSGKFFSDLGDRMIDDNFEITFELTAKPVSGLTSN
jgi:polyisoprenoid-binding protein YceI